MKNVRAGETRHHPFQSERLYCSNSAWYFMVRGGDSRGPFDDRGPQAVGQVYHHPATIKPHIPGSRARLIPRGYLSCFRTFWVAENTPLRMLTSY